MAANSKFDLCSQATALLGLGPVQSFSDGDKGAIAGRLYDTVVLSLVESYPWGFCKVLSDALPRLSDAPESQWTYFYSLPNDLDGVVWALYDEATIDARPFKEWERIGANIATNATAVYIKYAAITEVSAMPKYFHMLAVCALAAAFAQPMKESADLADFYHKRAFGTPEQNGKGGLWAMATAADARGSPSTIQRDNPFLDCR
jgi:hypothetical protein